MARLLSENAYGPAAAVIRSWSSTYRWIPIVAGLAAFALAFFTGANDVATSFGTSVGSGALRMWQAVALASLMEILGATLMGDRSLDSMPFHSILRERPPDAGLFMWALFIAIIAATLWLVFATYLEMPVTSLLSLLGSIMGVAFTARGVHAIYWNQRQDASISSLRIGGILEVFVSWFLAPAVAAVLAFVFFGITKLIFLRTEKAERRILLLMPLYYGMTVMVLIFFVIYKATPRVHIHQWDSARSALVAGLSGVMATVLASVIVVPYVRKQLGFFSSKEKKIEGPPVPSAPKDEEPEVPQEEQPIQQPEQEVNPDELIKQFNELRTLDTVYEAEEEENESSEASVKCSPVCGPASMSFGQFLARTPNSHRSFKRIRRPPRLTVRQKSTSLWYRIKHSTFDHEIHYSREDMIRHSRFERFNAKVEELFCFLQVLTACTTSFAHGSYEVAAVMGPYAAIRQIYQHRDQLPTRPVEIWIFSLGGVGVSLGFAICGWRLVRCLGGKITLLTPTRGFSAQLTAVATALLASRLKLPVSMTHILIGSVIGVGAADNVKVSVSDCLLLDEMVTFGGVQNVNWKLLVGFVVAWVATVLCTCGLSAALFSFTVFSPSYSVVG